jgi:hypothetical protein
MAAAVFTLSVSDGFAAKRASKAKMLARCEQRALECEQGCDAAYPDVVNDTSPRSGQYKACNAKCEDRVRKCRKRVEEINRTGGEGGGSEDGGGLLLAPD